MTGESALRDDALFEEISASHLPWKLDLSEGNAPRSRQVQLGDSRVVGCRIGGMVGRRRSAELRRTPGEFVALLMVHRGTEVLTQNGRTAEVTVGSAALWDGVRPVECFTGSALVKHTLFVPRELLSDSLPDLDAVLTRTLPPSSSLRLLSSWLQASMREPSLDSAASRTAGRMALELLQSSIGHAEGSPHDTQAVRLLRAKEFIDRHLGEPELTLAAVARANAVSLRYLHLLFHDSGETARQYLLRRRLERAQQLLLSRGTAIPVGEVAARCGFDSPSSFSRAYRARYGIPPRDARREHAVV